MGTSTRLFWGGGKIQSHNIGVIAGSEPSREVGYMPVGEQLCKHTRDNSLDSHSQEERYREIREE